jgi:ribose-phosphate pyrophosphokinase
MTIYDCVILADPKGNAWKFANEVCEILKEKDKQKGKKPKFDMRRVKAERFGDGEPDIELEKNIRRRNCFLIQDSSKAPCDWLVEIALVNETLRNSSCQEITDVLPYLRYSRQDRKDKSRVPISARTAAKIIERDADRVLTLDIHNPTIQGFYNCPVDNLYSFPTAIKYFKENYSDFLKNVVVLSPDAGGAKRAQAFANRIDGKNIDIAIGYKKRTAPGEIESLRITGDLREKNVLIIDDILDSGGTLINACEAAKKEGAKSVAAYCTHALFTRGTERICNSLDFVVIGDTITNPNLYNNPKIKVVSFVPLFADAIYKINEGESLSELFDEKRAVE